MAFENLCPEERNSYKTSIAVALTRDHLAAWKNLPPAPPQNWSWYMGLSCTQPATALRHVRGRINRPVFTRPWRFSQCLLPVVCVITFGEILIIAPHCETWTRRLRTYCRALLLAVSSFASACISKCQLQNLLKLPVWITGAGRPARVASEGIRPARCQLCKFGFATAPASYSLVLCTAGACGAQIQS